ncbi:GNAT family N-acetyltransferase [Virgibacillus kekensis]|uniref:GNAT family N-acetyltransferase n=1 Tax=Virgibacillus kekensis TaxID=202261 RepID=A0ABV9DGU3_9BACI
MEIRRLQANELKQAIQLSDQTFRKEEHTSMGEAFPQVFSKQLSQSFGAFDGERLISFIGVVPSKMQVGEAELNTFSIGSVCTHTDYRKQGISTAILKEVYDFIDQAKSSLLFVSGDRGLYKRNHCYHFGRVNKYKIDKVSIESKYEGSIREGSSADVFLIDDLIQAKEVKYKSSIWEWSMLFDASGYASIFMMKQTLYVAENDGVVEGYVVLGVDENSAAKRAIVTDWGGNTASLRAIFMELLKKKVVSEIEIAVPWQDSLNDELNDLPFELEQNGGTINIVDAERLIEQLKPYLVKKNPGLAKSLKIYNTDNSNVTLNYNESKITLSPEELVKFLFDFQDDAELGEMQSLFPVPLPSTIGMFYV